MITSSILLLCGGCFCLYNSSKKAVLSNHLAIEQYLQSHPRWSKAIGISLLTIGLLLVLPALGTTSGILFWLFSVSTILSLIIVLTPLPNIGYRPLIVLALLTLIFEIIL